MQFHSHWRCCFSFLRRWTFCRDFLPLSVSEVQLWDQLWLTVHREGSGWGQSSLQANNSNKTLSMRVVLSANMRNGGRKSDLSIQTETLLLNIVQVWWYVRVKQALRLIKVSDREESLFSRALTWWRPAEAAAPLQASGCVRVRASLLSEKSHQEGWVSTFPALHRNWWSPASNVSDVSDVFSYEAQKHQFPWKLDPFNRLWKPMMSLKNT